MDSGYELLGARVVTTAPLTVWYNARFRLSNGENRVNGGASAGGYLLSASAAHVVAQTRALLDAAKAKLDAGSDATAELEEAVHSDCLRVLAWHEDSLSVLPSSLPLRKLDFVRGPTGGEP